MTGTYKPAHLYLRLLGPIVAILSVLRYAHLHMHLIQWYLKDQIILDETAGSEAPSIQQGRIRAGSMVVENGIQLVSENFCISTSHFHYRCQCGMM